MICLLLFCSELSKHDKKRLFLCSDIITMYLNPLFSVITSSLIFQKKKKATKKRHSTPRPSLTNMVVLAEARKLLDFVFDRCCFKKCD